MPGGGTNVNTAPEFHAALSMEQQRDSDCSVPLRFHRCKFAFHDILGIILFVRVSCKAHCDARTRYLKSFFSKLCNDAYGYRNRTPI